MAEYSESLPPPVSTAALLSMEKRAAAELGASVPADYLTFLKEVNGFEWNGCMLYGAYSTDEFNSANALLDIISQNMAWRENGDMNNKYLFLGESGINWFVFDAVDANYKVLDLPSGDIIKQDITLSDLINTIVSEATE
jgi:hypothetical protein